MSEVTVVPSAVITIGNTPLGTMGWSTVTGKPTEFTPAGGSGYYVSTGGGEMTGALRVTRGGQGMIYLNNTNSPNGDPTEIRESNGGDLVFLHGYDGAICAVLERSGAPTSNTKAVVTVEKGDARYPLLDDLLGVKSVKSYGAAGDGVVDDTSAVQSALDAGGTVRFTEGTYLIDAPLDITVPKTSIIIESGATVLCANAPTTDSAMFEIASTAHGSSIGGGGVIDGNRDALTYPGTSPLLTGIRCFGANGVRYHGLTFQNTFHHAIYHGSGDDPVLDGLTVDGCGRAFAVQSCLNPTVKNNTIKDCGNNNIAMNQHCTAFRDFTGGFFGNNKILDWHPDTDGIEPNPTAWNFERASGFTDIGLHISGYSGTSSSGRAKGVKYDGCYDFVSIVTDVIGYNEGIMIKTCRDYSLTFSTLDGQYADTTDGDGLIFENGGLYDNFFGGALGQNSRSVAISENGTINGGIVTGFYNGVTGAASRHKFNNVISCGNVRDGWRFVDEAVGDDFTSIEPQFSIGTDLNGCAGLNNGRAGLYIKAGSDITVNGGRWNNNGQNTSEDANKRAGITHIGTEISGRRVRAIGVEAVDDQTWTQVDGASFAPGATDADNRMSVALLNPERYSRGQFVTLKNLTGSDETGWIVEKDKDDITVQFTSAKTAIDSGNLTALTGTISGTSGSTTLTGVGTAFDTEVTGHVYLKIGSEYHRVAVVESATELTLNTELTGTHAGVTAYLVQINVEAIQSQQYGLFATSGISIPPDLDATASGNVTGQVSLGGSDFGAGRTATAAVMRSGAVSVTGLSSYADNAAALSGGLAAGDLYIRTGHGLDAVV